jgi:hypothetical protein
MQEGRRRRRHAPLIKITAPASRKWIHLEGLAEKSNCRRPGTRSFGQGIVDMGDASSYTDAIALVLPQSSPGAADSQVRRDPQAPESRAPETLSFLPHTIEPCFAPSSLWVLRSPTIRAATGTWMLRTAYRHFLRGVLALGGIKRVGVFTVSGGPHRPSAQSRSPQGWRRYRPSPRVPGRSTGMPE